MKTERTKELLELKKKKTTKNIYIYKCGSKFSKISKIIAFKLVFSQLQATECNVCSMKSNEVLKKSSNLYHPALDRLTALKINVHY